MISTTRAWVSQHQLSHNCPPRLKCTFFRLRTVNVRILVYNGADVLNRIQTWKHRSRYNQGSGYGQLPSCDVHITTEALRQCISQIEIVSWIKGILGKARNDYNKNQHFCNTQYNFDNRRQNFRPNTIRFYHSNLKCRPTVHIKCKQIRNGPIKARQGIQTKNWERQCTPLDIWRAT